MLTRAAPCRLFAAVGLFAALVFPVGVFTATSAAAQVCDVNYIGGCVPIVAAGTLNCDDISFAVRVVGLDIHDFDREGDGVGCEGNGPAPAVPATPTTIPVATATVNVPVVATTSTGTAGGAATGYAQCGGQSCGFESLPQGSLSVFMPREQPTSGPAHAQLAVTGRGHQLTSALALLLVGAGLVMTAAVESARRRVS